MDDATRAMVADIAALVRTRRDDHPAVLMAEVAMLRTLLRNVLESFDEVAADMEVDPAINEYAKGGAMVMLNYYREYLTKGMAAAADTLAILRNGDVEL